MARTHIACDSLAIALRSSIFHVLLYTKKPFSLSCTELTWRPIYCSRSFITSRPSLEAKPAFVTYKMSNIDNKNVSAIVLHAVYGLRLTPRVLGERQATPDRRNVSKPNNVDVCGRKICRIFIVLPSNIDGKPVGVGDV